MNRLLPSYPLFVNDPYFSIWINNEDFSAVDTQFWTGAKSSLYGLVKSKTSVYSFLGVMSKALPLKQTKLTLTAFSTDCEYECREFRLKVRFISPLLLTDIKLMSRPVCYLEYEIESLNNDNEYEVMLVANENICYEHAGQIRGGKFNLDNYSIAWFGLRHQKPLGQAGDAIKCDYGNYYIVGQNAKYVTTWEIDAYSRGVKDLEYYYCDDAPKAICAYDTVVKNGKGKLMLAFDDTVSIFYFGEFLKGYYFSTNKTIFDAIKEAYNDFDETKAKLDAFDARLKSEALEYGEEYLNVLYASLRQSIAAHKLCADKNGDLLFLSKECNSNGCIATVDVSYPSMPLFLKYNPELLKAMLVPIFKFARMPVWEYAFAPHDVGTYPYCSGQNYSMNGQNNEMHENTTRRYDEPNTLLYQMPKGSGILSLFSQMPVEECANMIIMTLAYIKFGKDKKIISENFDLLSLWADYLSKNYMSKENELCTDDFAGHLAQNINLSIKACVGMGAFGKICKRYNMIDLADRYLLLAKSASDKITSNYENYTHTPLTFNSSEDTYSIKYNLAFDVILSLNLFSEEFREREIDYILTKKSEYGFPLDNRKRYTKSDWMMWSCAFTKDKNKRKEIISFIDKWLKNSPTRVPFGDWFNIDTGVYLEFKNRSVQGASFMPLIID